MTVEFRRITGCTRTSDVFLRRCELEAVPDRGEVINVEGEPYVVHERDWAVDRIDVSDLYCYIRLSPLQGAR